MGIEPQELHRDVGVERTIVRAVHGPHRPRPDTIQELVAAADHVPRTEALAVQASGRLRRLGGAHTPSPSDTTGERDHEVPPSLARGLRLRAPTPGACAV